MTQVDAIPPLQREIEQALKPIWEEEFDDIDAEDRQKIARRYEKKLYDLDQRLEAEWIRLLITERDVNSSQRQRISDQRSRQEFELFARALGLLPLAHALKTARQKLWPASPEQSSPEILDTLNGGLDALKSGDLAAALALLADISEADRASRIQYQREIEADRLLQEARNLCDTLTQIENRQEQAKARYDIRQKFIEPIMRIGREVQREAARDLLPPPSGLWAIVASPKRWIPIAALVLVLLCGALGVWPGRFFQKILVAMNNATPTPSVALETATNEPLASPETSPSTPEIAVSTSTLTGSETPALEPTITTTSEPITPTPSTTPTVTETDMPSPDVIKIALQSPQTGEWAGIGIGIRRGAELSILQQNTPLTSLGFRVEFAPFDDAGNAAQGIANAQQIVADSDVLCMVGHFNSGVTLAAYEAAYANSELVVISPGATNPNVTDGTEHVWRLVGRDDVQGTVAAQFARNILQRRNAYVIHDNTTYGRGIASFFRDDARKNGLELLAFTFFDDSLEEVDFTSYLDDIQEGNPDLIFFAGSYSRAGVFFKQARERGITAQFLGSDSIDNPGLVEIAGADVVNGMYFTTVAAPVSAFSGAKQFALDYKQTYGEDAPAFSPEAYDATTLCIQAIARASQANGGAKPTRQQVIEAMKTFELRERRFNGISGTYRFDPNGDPVQVAYFVVQANAASWSENKVVQQLFCSSDQCSETPPP